MNEPLRHDDPVSIAAGVRAQLVDAQEEAATLQALIEANREYIAALEERLAELDAYVGVRRELNGGDVRDTVARLATFTFAELVTELGEPAAAVRKFFKPMLLNGTVRDSGARIGRAPIYEYVKPVGASPARERRSPPELSTAPAGSERRATGLPVRVAAVEKLTRRGRSTPGTAHIHKVRDRNYERMQAAKEQSAEAQKAKAQKPPKWQRKKGK